MIETEDRRKLIDVARRSMRAAIAGEPFEPGIPEDGPLAEDRGAFVTITKGGALRGCIGRVLSDRPLVAVVAEMARAAALEDPRFPPVGADELDGLDIEISAMGRLRRVDGPRDVTIGRDGLIVRQGGRSGLLLPQVATDHGCDAERFLEETCRKAGLPGDAWREGSQIEAFGAEVWGE